MTPDITPIRPRPDLQKDKKAFNTFLRFKLLIEELREKELTDEVVQLANEKIDQINGLESDDHSLRRTIKKAQAQLLNLLEKRLHIVPKNHYQNLWMGVGMAAFGIPVGVALGTSLGNLAYIGLGLPLGLAIGVGIGQSKDQKAQKEGRQLDLEL